MFLRIFWIVLALLSMPKMVVAQGHQELLEIIGADMPNNQKQSQLDAFITKSLPTLSLKERAECFHDLGGKWYYQNFIDTDDKTALEKAINLTLKSLELKRQLLPPEYCTINRTLYNLGRFYSNNDEVYIALDYLMEVIRKGREYCPNGGAENLIELAYHGIGDLYMEIGDFYKALEIYENLISDYSAREALENEGAIWAFIRRAQIYSAIDLKRNSNLIRSNLDMALYYLKKSETPCCYYENRINQLEADRLSKIKDYSTSIKYYKAVISNLPVTDSFNLAVVNNSLGLSHLELGDKKLAEEILLKTLLLNPNYDSPHNNLGDLSVKNTQFEKALESYQRAIDLSIGRNLRFRFDQLPSYEQIEYSSNKIKLLNHLITKANAWIKYYEHDNNNKHLRHALETFTLADQLVDLIRFESAENQSKLYWREQGASLYMKAIEVCHLLDKPKEAYRFMERNKALLLLEDLTNEEAKDIAQLPQNLAQREYKLKRNIFLAENELFETDLVNIGDIDSLKTTIRESKYVYLEFIDSLNTSYPDYAKFKKKVDVLTFENLKTNYVSDTKAVLHYILNEEQGYGLLTLANTTLLYKMENIPKLNENVETLIAALSDGISDIDKFQKVSHAVFRQLLPVNSYGKIKGKQLLIIPDYTLQRIPFETLVVNNTESKYLIEEVEIGYAYSASLLDYSKRTERNAEENFLGFAPVQFNDLKLPQLSFSEKEIEGIADVLPGKTLLNGSASKANFIENVNQHKIVHLATHADIGDGENPWIAFSDSKMYLKEIYATRNQADMVVLSACNTSNGELKRGEGVMSLARGFFYSGAKSVVSSLWPIEDEAGKDILIDFYKNLGQGDSKSKALQKAKLSYLKTTEEEELKHPFYWAGFVVLGDNAPVAEAFNWNWILILLALTIVFVLAYRFRSRPVNTTP